MKNGCCFNTFCWILQILVWLFLIFTIVFFVADVSAKIPVLILFIAFYIAYISLEFCSMVCKYLCNKTSENGIYNKVSSYYRSYPVFQFYCECYHYETRKRRVTSTYKGKKRTKVVTQRVRVTTHRERYDFPYYSERDVSGLFYLDCDRAYISRKKYIELDILSEINFADAISCYDYEVAKDRFWRRNRFRDRCFHFEESRYIPGLQRNNLVSLSGSEPCCVNCCAFVFYTFITFAEIYKIYYYSLTIRQTYRIRKLVSTRYDLNQPVYEPFIPQLDLISLQYNFQFDDYNYINNNFHLVAPTPQELEKAKPYQSKVPDYKISSGGGKIHAGVIMDDPSYSSYNLNKPPEAFTSIAGEVALNKNQVNANGDLPQGFDQPGFKFNTAKDDSDSDDDNQPKQVYGSNTIAVQNNNTNYNQRNINTIQPQQIQVNSTERTLLKDNQQNPQGYGPINSRQSNIIINEHYPPQNNIPQNYPPQNNIPQNYPPQNNNSQNYPPQNYPPQNYPPQQYPAQQYNNQQYPPQNLPAQSYPPQQYPGQQYGPQQSQQQYQMNPQQY